MSVACYSSQNNQELKQLFPIGREAKPNGSNMVPKKSLRAYARQRREGLSPSNTDASSLDQQAGPFRCFAVTLSSKLDNKRLFGILAKEYETSSISEDYDLLHIQYQPQHSIEDSNSNQREIYKPTKNVFFFKEGCMVCWGMSPIEEKNWVERISEYIPNQPHPVIKEQMNFFLGEKTAIFNDTIELSKYSTSEESKKEMLAYSYGLVRSLLLEVIEVEMESESLKQIFTIPQTIKNGRLPKLAAWEKIIAEHMHLRSKLNLNSTLLDIPDIFWEDHYMGVLFAEMQENMDIHDRIDILNKRLDFIENITSTVQTTLTERYSAKLEKIIIVLIALEVLFYLADKSERWRNFTYESFLGISTSSSTTE